MGPAGPEDHVPFVKPALALHDLGKYLRGAEINWLAKIQLEDLPLSETSRGIVSQLKYAVSNKTSLALAKDISDLPTQIRAVIDDLDRHQDAHTRAFWTAGTTRTTKKRLQSLVDFLERLREDNAKENIEWTAVEDTNSTQMKSWLQSDNASRTGSRASTLLVSHDMSYKPGSSFETDCAESTKAEDGCTTISDLKSWSIQSWFTSCFGGKRSDESFSVAKG